MMMKNGRRSACLAMTLEDSPLSEPNHPPAQPPSPTYSWKYPNIPNIPAQPILGNIQISQISQPNLFLQISNYHEYYSPTYSYKYPNIPVQTFLANTWISQICMADLLLQLYQTSQSDLFLQISKYPPNMQSPNYSNILSTQITNAQLQLHFLKRQFSSNSLLLAKVGQMDRCHHTLPLANHFYRSHCSQYIYIALFCRRKEENS